MKKILIYISVLISGIVIVVPRFYHLGSQPPGLHIDEVSFAADAKAIASTGRDTWNVRYPVIFKAFGEWKAPGLVYSMAFWSKMLGRMDNEISRLPSAIAGITILVMLALTLKQVFPLASKSFLFFVVFVIAFSPWHFDMSRIFYEAFSALAIFSISLYFVTKATISKSLNTRDWVLAAIFAGLSGYWYASIRYIVIALIPIVVLVQPWSWRDKLKKGLLLMLVLLTVGSLWVGDLVSDKGLNRLYYYRTKSQQGATLEIDEKRQYCFLSVGRDQNLVKPCYYIWNKPVYKTVNAIKMYYTYLGTDFLFLKGASEYGFDSEYGAYLPPLLPIYLVGLFVFLRGALRRRSATDRVYLILLAVALISLVPPSLANNLNMRMGLISLYIVAIIIAVGFKTILDSLKNRLISLVYILILLFFIIQSTMHYFLVFTRSNDLMWTSDAGEIFGYVKSVSANYDHIVDAELHGPLAPYFYGDLSTSDVQNGSHSSPDNFGFTYLTHAGKYELRHVNIKDLACEKNEQGNKQKMLVITSPVADLSPIRKFAGKSWSGALLLHEVYDVDDIIAHELETNINFAKSCAKK